MSLPIDDSAFKTVYFDHHQKAYRVAYYILKNEQAAEDLVQEVFLKLWEKRDGIGQISNLEAYVHQMVKNAAFTLIKSTPNYQSEMIELAYEQPSHEEDNGLKSAIEKAVSELTPKCRLVFSMSRFEGLTNDEIAEHLDMSKRTVETQISNALKMFRSDLKHFFEEYLVTVPILISFFSTLL